MKIRFFFRVIGKTLAALTFHIGLKNKLVEQENKFITVQAT